MNRERQIYLLTVASLLHDIGKAFLKIGGSIPEELDAFINERYNGKKYHHYLGAALVEIACNSTNLSDEHKEDLLIISKLIRGHHELQGTDWSEKNEFYNEIINGTDEELKKLLKILIKADHMSARERDISNTEFPESETNDTHISEDKKNSDKLLKPIFPLEDLSKIKNPEPLLIGYESFDFNRETKPTANEVYQSIKKHLMNYNRKAGWVQTLLYILKEYTFFIQSYKQSKAPHISLYSHSITTAAIASSLIFSGIHGPIAVVWLKLGGLQNFINMLEDKDFKGKGGSKVLRGRSKYIETLTYEIVYKITTYCGLTPANAVMISSGKALLLLPTSEVNKASEVLQNYRRLLLLDLRIDLLKLGMGSSNLTDINKDGSGFDEIIKQAIIKAEKSTYVDDQITGNIECIEGGYCEICGSVITTKSKKESRMCKVCVDCTKLGSSSSCVLIFPYEIQKHFEVINFNELNTEKLTNDYIILIDSNTINKDNKKKAEILNNCGVEILLSPNNIENKLDDILNGGEDNRFAIVALDFDKLGRRYEEKSRESISSNIAFSLFMKRELNKMLQDAFKGSYFFLLYAGGDDAIFAGKVDDCLKALNKLSNHLKSMQRHYLEYFPEKEITFTAAYILYRDGYPIAKAFNEVETRLKLLKQLQHRNSIYLSYAPIASERKILKFGSEFNSTFLDKVSEVRDLIKKKRISKSFLYWLKNLYDKLAYSGLPKHKIPRRENLLVKMIIEGHKNYGWYKKLNSESFSSYKQLKEINDKFGQIFIPIIFTAILLER